MQTARIVQAAVLMMIVALAASCAASKEYTSKIFAPRNEPPKDSQAIAVKFIDMDSTQQSEDGWVSTDIIMGRDTAGSTAALDNLAKVYPAKSETVIAKNEKTEEERKAMIKNKSEEEKKVTAKRDEKIISVPERKAEEQNEPAVVKNTPYGTIRNKKTRTDKP